MPAFGIRLGLNNVAAALSRLQAKLSRAAWMAWWKVTDAAAKSMIHWRWKSRTGELARSIGPEIEPYNGTFEFRSRAVAMANHAAWIDKGTKRHVIKAKNAKTLRFFWRGHWRFPTQVNHPGIKPRLFSLHARAVFERQISQRLERAMRAAAK